MKLRYPRLIINDRPSFAGDQMCEPLNFSRLSFNAHLRQQAARLLAEARLGIG